ncbi:LysR family transcriptional regulator [Leucothrix pacifica]|uniref:LysR family transcriptional regulator n=1 Tax=Leucothrix pacifica TaxID=1247513 RepID=A0A317C9H7_9GAMM|nr:LysR family transcriptional regulator [Leucothrix pacifica]PWQ92712.1 LysR family transcriptional regulator [Leucothrix pacifica]
MKNEFSGRIADTDIRLLRIYKAVVECGGFAAAEVTLNISRAAISIAMSDLEQRLSLRLCQRGRGGFSLTDQGQQVYQAILQLLSALEDFRTQVNGIHTQLKGELNIGITDNLVTMPRMRITRAIKALKEKGPDVTVNIRMTPPSEIEMAVLDGRLHIGVVPTLKPLSGLSYLPLYDEESQLYCSNTHQLFMRDESDLSLEDIHASDAVLPAYAQSPEVKALYQSMKSTATATDREGIAFLILTGQYIGYLPTHFAERWLLKGSLRALLPKQFSYSTHYTAITRKNARPNLVLESYLEEL